MISFSRRIIFGLSFSLLLAANAASAQTTSNSFPVPKQATLTLELQDLPGRNAPGSVWEVSYEWRIADERAFDQWSAGGENALRQAKPGALLSKGSFARRNLSRPENRRFSISVPITGEVLERMRAAEQRRQIVWLDATIRIHDVKLGIDLIRKVNPAWGPRFYRDGIASVQMEMTAQGKLQWFTTAIPPWADKQSGGMKINRPPNQ
jgi:hypothetical protein